MATVRAVAIPAFSTIAFITAEDEDGTVNEVIGGRPCLDICEALVAAEGPEIDLGDGSG